jgi:hypothetical protein
MPIDLFRCKKAGLRWNLGVGTRPGTGLDGRDGTQNKSLGGEIGLVQCEDVK